MQQEKKLLDSDIRSAASPKDCWRIPHEMKENPLSYYLPLSYFFAHISRYVRRDWLARICLCGHGLVDVWSILAQRAWHLSFQMQRLSATYSIS